MSTKLWRSTNTEKGEKFIMSNDTSKNDEGKKIQGVEATNECKVCGYENLTHNKGRTKERFSLQCPVCGTVHSYEPVTENRKIVLNPDTGKPYLKEKIDQGHGFAHIVSGNGDVFNISILDDIDDSRVKKILFNMENDKDLDMTKSYFTMYNKETKKVEILFNAHPDTLENLAKKEAAAKEAAREKAEREAQVKENNPEEYARLEKERREAAAKRLDELEKLSALNKLEKETDSDELTDDDVNLFDDISYVNIDEDTYEDEDSSDRQLQDNNNIVETITEAEKDVEMLKELVTKKDSSQDTSSEKEVEIKDKLDGVTGDWFYLEYNPYKNETVFESNIEDGIDYDKFKIIQMRKYRMQVWLEKSDGWDGFMPELCKNYKGDNITVIFKGRKIDYEDLAYYVEPYETNINITLKYIEAKNDADILNEINNVIDKLKESPIEELKFEDVRTTYEKVKSARFPISVIATMSSGKSTIINSILGTELLPSKNEACTATVARITDSENKAHDNFMVECRDIDGKVVVEKTLAIPENIEKYNDDPNVMYIDIEGSIPEIDSSNMRLVLQDTPGPNNSLDAKHSLITQNILKSNENSVIMYIMNATQFAVADDKHLLENIAEIMKKQGKQSRDRFIFVVNKCDQLDPDKGETVEKLLVTVRKYLKESFQIDEPNLFPVSALTAKIIRKHLNGEKLTRSEKRALDVDLFLEEEKCHFENYAKLSPSCRALVKRKFEEAKAIEDEEESEYQQVLIHTGIPAIEAAINEYLNKYAYPIKIEEAIKDFVATIEEQSMRANFDEKIANNAAQLNEIRAQLKDAYEKHQIGQKASIEFKKRINQLELNEQIISDRQIEIEMYLDRLLERYIGIDEVDIEEATNLVTKFNDEIISFQYTYADNLQASIEKELIAKGEKMLAEYKSYLDSILVNIQVGNFDFFKVRAFEQKTFKSVNELISSNVHKEEVYEDVEHINFNRNWYEFWKPKTVTMRRAAGVRQTVNISQLVQNEITDVSNIIKANIENIFRNAQKQTEEFKTEFNNNIDSLNQVVEGLLNEINEKVSDTEKVKAEIEANKSKILWINDIKKQLDDIMKF